MTFKLHNLEKLPNGMYRVRSGAMVSKTENKAPFAKKTSNQGNIRVVVDGINFQSKKEAERYTLLKLLEKTGKIQDLKRQVPFELNKNGTHSLIYYADFCYYENGVYVVNDVKPFDKKSGKFRLSQLFKKKSRLMFKLYSITIKLS